MPAKRKLTDADRVWNRACYREGTDLREGDLALGALLLVDGYIQNGGVGHAFDLPPDELAEGIKAYEFFGLGELTAVIKAYEFFGIGELTVIRPHRGEEEADYNRRYYQLANDANLIQAKFEEMFREHPERFAPLNQAAGE